MLRSSRLVALGALLLLSSCTPQAKVYEADLCKARRVIIALEAADESLKPKPDSARAEIERVEDALCATVNQ